MKAEAARPLIAKKHRWFSYNGKKPLVLKMTSGTTYTLEKGETFGVQNISTETDRLVPQSRPDLRFLLPARTVSKILDDSKRVKEAVDFIPVAKPTPVRPKPAMPKLKPTKKSPADRLEAIRKAVKNKDKTPKPAATKPVPPKKITIRNTDPILDDDMFLLDDNSDLADFL